MALSSNSVTKTRDLRDACDDPMNRRNSNVRTEQSQMARGPSQFAGRLQENARLPIAFPLTATMMLLK